MGFFDLLFGNNEDKNHKAKEQEMANMYEYGYDEIEQCKSNNKALECEKFSNYEYFSEEE